MTDYFSTHLQPSSFDGIEFPLANLSDAESNSFATHTKLDRDGAYIELTGTTPRQFKLSIPLFNGQRKGPNAGWSNLFPETHVRLQQTFRKRTRAKFIHPELGEIWCKAIDWQSSIVPGMRDGVMMEVSLIESSEDDQPITSLAQFGLGIKAAKELQSTVSVYEFEQPNWVDLEGFLRSIQGIFDASNLLIDSMIGKFESINAAIKRLIDSAEALHERDPAVDIGRILASCDVIIEVINSAQNHLLGTTKRSALIITSPTSWNTASSLTNNQILQLMELNSGLVGKAVIPPDSILYYYL